MIRLLAVNPGQRLGPTSSPTFAGLTITGTATFASTVTATGQFLAGDGSAVAPAYSFATTPNSGLMKSTVDGSIVWVRQGVSAGRLDYGIVVRGDYPIGFCAAGTSEGAADLTLYRDAAANLRQGAAAAADADGVAQTLRSPGGGTVSSGTTGKNGGAYTITAGAGSDAKAASNANGGNGGILTLTGGAKGLKDGGGSDGLDGGVQVSRTGGLLGFYGTAPVALQTGVAVSAAGVHAALVNLGLITA